MSKIPPKFVGLQHIAIKVHDIELARRFYTEILGFTITENYNREKFRISRLDCVSCGARNCIMT